ncbi:MAG: hypothetical protein ABI397_02500 [Candidatus Saccharimonas sp.]
MASDEKDEKNKTTQDQQAPADALSRTPDELEEEAIATGTNVKKDSGAKKLSPFKQFLRKINVYLLMFLVILAVSIIFTVVLYLNSAKIPVAPTIESQQLTQDALKKLANTDASVGNTSQTLTIQGNAVIAGQTLMRGDLNVAGNLQTGGSIQGPSLTISGQSNLGPTQINNLQVSGNTAVQGDVSLKNLSVAGTSTFAGAMTASQLTVTNLTLSGNATLQVPNHISFPGSQPARASIDASVLGAGGSASINGSDTAGTVNVNTGNNPVPGCFVKFTFNQRYSNTPRVIISPVGAAAGQAQYYAIRDNAGFSVCSANAMMANQVFAYDYFITN